jgi:hypothetical protein
MYLTRRNILMVASILMLSARTASADFNDLLARVPAGANAIALIDVKGLVSSQMGVQNKWQDKLTHPDSTSPVIVPADATRVVVASWIEPTSMESLWDTSVIELSRAPSMERIAKTQGGFVETVAEKQAAWSPMNAYFIRLDTRVLGAVGPADRQFTARWARQTGSVDQRVSPYLQSAAASMSPDTQYLFALDLQDVASAKRVRRRLSMGEFSCLADKNIDVEKVSATMAGIKGLMLKVAVGDAAMGKGVIEFDRPASALASFAKPLLLEFLAKCAVSIDDFGAWNVAVKGSSLTFDGELSGEGLRKLLSIVDPPSPPQTAEGDQTKGEGTDGGSDQKVVIAASREYFKSATAIIDNIGKQIRNSTSMTQGAVYIGRSAKRLGRLPIVNVDPVLLDWGTSVSAQMANITSVLGVGGFQARSSAVGIQDANVNGSYTVDGAQIVSDPNDAVNRTNVMRQRLSATAEQKAKTTQATMQILQAIELSRNQIRIAMTQKYKAEF